MMLCNLSVPMVALVDSAVVGHLPHAQDLAAVVIGSSLYGLLVGLMGFLRMGTSGFSAQACGSGDGALLRQTLTGHGMQIDRQLRRWQRSQTLRQQCTEKAGQHITQASTGHGGMATLTQPQAAIRRSNQAACTFQHTLFDNARPRYGPLPDDQPAPRPY